MGGTLFIKLLDFFAFGSGTSELLLNISPNQNQNHEENNLYTKSNIISFIICFTGLQVSFLSWGVVQERIIKYDYIPITIKSLHDFPSSNTYQHERFKNTQFLVLSNRLAGLIISSAIMLVFKKPQFRTFKDLQKIVSVKHWAPLFICSYTSLSNVISSCFQVCLKIIFF